MFNLLTAMVSGSPKSANAASKPSRSKKAAPVKTQRPVDKLVGAVLDEESGLFIGTMTIGSQLLRVGIRPLPAGKVASTPPVLLFNGIGANLELAGLLIKHLENVETIIFDVPGAGKSPSPKHPYRIFQLASLSRKLLDELGYDEVDVMGVSWGGGLAQQFAIQYPKRVRRLILAATAMGSMTMVPGNIKVLLKMVNPKRYVDKNYMKRVAPDLYGGDLRTDPNAIKLFTDHAKGGNQVGYRYQILAMMGWTSLPWLWRMRQPTLILAGDDDPLVPLINAKVQKFLMRNARLHVFNDGHLFLLTRAKETADVIAEFLEHK